jgi:hypothetical protein
MCYWPWRSDPRTNNARPRPKVSAELRESFGTYQQLVAKCQSPRFTLEAERLARELGSV